MCFSSEKKILYSESKSKNSLEDQKLTPEGKALYTECNVFMQSNYNNSEVINGLKCVSIAAV